MKPSVNVASFLKLKEHNPFCILPVVSEPIFPQFKGPRTPRVVCTRHQQDKFCLYLASAARHLIVWAAQCVRRIFLVSDNDCSAAHHSSSKESENHVPDEVLFCNPPQSKHTSRSNDREGWISTSSRSDSSDRGGRRSGKFSAEWFVENPRSPHSQGKEKQDEFYRMVSEARTSFETAPKDDWRA